MLEKQEDSLKGLVGKLNTACDMHDWDGVKRVARIMQARFEPVGDMQYGAKRLFERMDEWSQITHGTVDTQKLLEILVEEGVMQ